MSMQVTIECKAPLFHGAFGESAGNASLLRRMAVVSAPGHPRVPVVSGNALRGILRRIVMRDLLARCELDRASVEPGKWDRLYAAIANGGHLERAEKRVDPDAIRALRDALPPLSVFGAALYSWLLAGHMSVGFLWLVCRESVEGGLIEDDGREDCRRGAEEMVEEVSLVRHVDREDQSPELSGVTPMPTTVEAIAAGSRLRSSIRFAAHASEVERSAVAYGLARLEQGSIGGKGGAGFGRVTVRVDGDADVAPYSAWLSEIGHAREALLALAEELARPKGAKA